MHTSTVAVSDDLAVCPFYKSSLGSLLRLLVKFTKFTTLQLYVQERFYFYLGLGTKWLFGAVSERLS